ncbi:glycosyltransferase WbsX family protein [Paenibacillus graminis]|uniref:Glycosyl transferase n=1 Tax=Paenibacillus graminis TaxID=189425 RepID=A0A089ME97_9BACL|nr:glycoside hydrolase family 99-like domain-containing protein [Paenibacillus graminis]AIQ70695.1 glycosyl transferase [Paenibacillus graminis]
MKIIAFYLPQFHSIPENDEWWGEGFTEWKNVKKAQPLFKDHYQPRVPLNGNYYNLLDDEVKKWQINLAKKYGVYGFCFYHYWFDGKLLLEKPIEQFKDNSELNHPYCMCWANENWTNAWVADKDPKTLMSQRYGDKPEWKTHFDYLLPFFLDDNYIKEEGKPLFVIYRPEIIDCLNEMLDYWQALAVESGLSGINFAYQQLPFYLKKDKDDSRFRYNIEYQPGYALHDMKTNDKDKSSSILYKFRTSIREVINTIDKTFKTNFIAKFAGNKLRLIDFNEAWKSIIKRGPTNNKSIPGSFVGWDNTPRRQNGTVYTGSTPAAFQEHMINQIKNARDIYKTDKIFLFAWNEWAEGGYMEPDEKYKYGYLEALNNALIETGEKE